MAQAGILGRLHYIDASHSWTLDLGRLLVRYDFCGGSLTDDSVPGIEEARYSVVADINEILALHSVVFTIPPIVPGAKNSIVPLMEGPRGLLARMRQSCSSAHIAFMLIGSAGVLLDISGASKSQIHNEELRDQAYNRLKGVQALGGEPDFKPDAFFYRLLETDLSSTAVRTLLRKESRALPEPPNSEEDAPPRPATSAKIAAEMKKNPAMAQAGVLGNLEFSEDQHGWALDLGRQSENYKLLSGSPSDEEVCRNLVKQMNRILSSNRIRYTIPELRPGIAADHGEICGNLLEVMRRDTTPNLLAYYLIGGASFFVIMKDATPEHKEEFVRLALNRLHNIAIRCPGIQIDPERLLECFLTAKDMSSVSVRLLLRDLQKPLVIHSSDLAAACPTQEVQSQDTGTK